jgi:pimeloyl-ACP methyl ester carboxylesterase
LTTRTDTFLRRWGTVGVALLLAGIWLGPLPCLANSLVLTEVSFGGTPHYSYVTLSVRPGATQTFLLMDVKDAKATVILFAGGDGRLNLNPLGFGSNLQANFLVRTRDFYAAHGIRVVIVDAPSAPAIWPNFRLTAEHAQDIQAVIGYLHRRFHDPVWLVGTSSGTVSAANAASRLSGNDGPNGLVLTSSVLDAEGMSVFGTHLAAITVPTLVVHHEQDACPATLFANVPALMAALTSASKLELVSFTGGGPAVGGDCDAFHWHGYIGIEAQVTDTIADFILAHRRNGHGGHDH